MNERDIAEKMIADAEALAKEGKAKLAELDKPLLRHGDKCIAPTASTKGIYIALNSTKFNDDDTFEIWGTKNGTPFANGRVSKNTTYYVPIDETIFDDLERNSEDLTEFEVGQSADLGLIKMRLARSLIVITAVSEDGVTTVRMSIDESTEIHQKLGQMIAFAKRKANG